MLKYISKCFSYNERYNNNGMMTFEIMRILIGPRKFCEQFLSMLKILKASSIIRCFDCWSQKPYHFYFKKWSYDVIRVPSHRALRRNDLQRDISPIIFSRKSYGVHLVVIEINKTRLQETRRIFFFFKHYGYCMGCHMHVYIVFYVRFGII